MKKQQFIEKDTPSRNWQIEIETIFSNEDSVTKLFAENWYNVLNDPIVSFIIYRLIYPYPNKGTIECENNISISVFLELNNYVRKKTITRLFAFNNNFFTVEKKYGFSANSIKEIIDKCSDIEKELFWKGIPRYNNNISSETSYSFVIEHNLKEKARKKPRVPLFMEKLLLKKSDVYKTPLKRNTKDLSLLDLRNSPTEKEIDIYVNMYIAQLNINKFVSSYNKTNSGIEKREIFFQFLAEIINSQIEYFIFYSGTISFMFTISIEKSSLNLKWKNIWLILEFIMNKYVYKKNPLLKGDTFIFYLQKELEIYPSRDRNSFEKDFEEYKLFKIIKSKINIYTKLIQDQA